MTFSQLAIGQRFTCNGNPYTKRSSRTANVGEGHPAHREGAQRWFYFRQHELVKVQS
jgi:hypothetical protein